MASLFSACKSAIRNNSGGTYNIGGYDIELELYHQEDIEEDVTYGDVVFGDSDESKIVVVSGDTITVPSGYTLTPDSPKKSLVIFCNNLVNNGTISMYQKAPNVLPHDYLIIEDTYYGGARDIVIPAYAGNAVSRQNLDQTRYVNGNNGTNRQCGSGGTGSIKWWMGTSGTCTVGATGSGYAFGGGAGSGAVTNGPGEAGNDVNSTYPMRGSAWGGSLDTSRLGHVNGGNGNPTGANSQNNQTFTGCGGRVIIFCCNFTNNGSITVNGTSITNDGKYSGGASGAGAVDLFYTNKIIEGTITATGGVGARGEKANNYSGSGGNGSITLTAWTQSKLVKGEAKFFSQSNVDYLLEQLAERIRDSRMGE